MYANYGYIYNIAFGNCYIKYIVIILKKFLFLILGAIIWRQILEKGEHGTIQAMYVDVEMVTVSGSGPFTVRGWNANLGSMLYEWSVSTARCVFILMDTSGGK